MRIYRPRCYSVYGRKLIFKIIVFQDIKRFLPKNLCEFWNGPFINYVDKLGGAEFAKLSMLLHKLM